MKWFQREKVYREFLIGDGRKVILRSPKMGDLKDLLVFINSLVDEKADIPLDVRLTRQEEAEWLRSLLSEAKKGCSISIVAEIDGEIIGNASVHRGIGRRSHVGTLDIAVTKALRNMGIGTAMIKTFIEESRGIGLRSLHLSIFDSNISAKCLYSKIGFREVGRWPRAIRKGECYVDEICMALEL